MASYLSYSGCHCYLYEPVLVWWKQHCTTLPSLHAISVSRADYWLFYVSERSVLLLCGSCSTCRDCWTTVALVQCACGATILLALH